MLFHTLCITLNKYKLEYLSNYGCDHKSGWFVTYDGSVIQQFEKTALSAIWKAHPKIRAIKEYNHTTPNTES